MAENVTVETEHEPEAAAHAIAHTSEQEAHAAGVELGRDLQATEDAVADTVDDLNQHRIDGHPHTHSAEELGLGDVWPKMNDLQSRLETVEKTVLHPILASTEEGESGEAGPVEIVIEPPAEEEPPAVMVKKRRRLIGRR